MGNQAFENLQGPLGGLLSSADFSSLQRRLVKMGTVAGQVAQAGLGEQSVGALRNAPSASGEAVSLPRVGDIMVCEAGAAVTIGGSVMPDASGQLVDAPAGAPAVGYVVTTGAAANDWVAVLFMPHVAGLASPSVDGNASVGSFRATYDVTGGDTGAVGTFDMGVDLPDNAVVTRAYYYVETTFVSATDAGTIALGINTDDASGLVAAVAISDGSNPWDAGWGEAIQDGTAANFAEATTAAGRAIEAVVAVEAMTAGKLILFGDYKIID